MQKTFFDHSVKFNKTNVLFLAICNKKGLPPEGSSPAIRYKAAPFWQVLDKQLKLPHKQPCEDILLRIAGSGARGTAPCSERSDVKTARSFKCRAACLTERTQELILYGSAPFAI